MKLKVLKELISRIESHPRDYDNYDVVIRTQGMSGSCSKIESISVGFDWYANKICLHPENKLISYDLHKLQRLREILLSEVSKIDKLAEQTFYAEYRLKSSFHSTKLDAVKWINEMLNNDIEQ